MSPPIRSKEHQGALIHGLVDESLTIIATDHAVFNSTQKAKGKPPQADFRTLPNGVNGIEERMHVTWDKMVNSGLISPSAYVSITSAETAKVFNIFPQKGHIAPGSDADVILFDPEVEHTISAATHHSRMDTNIYEGYTMKGKVVMTISQGNVVWENEKLNTVEGAGRYIKMEPFGYLFDDLDKLEPAPKPYGPTPVPRDYGSSESKDEL